jgi:lysophospholipase L1-like esterase
MAAPGAQPLHYLALGDSYTIGEGVSADARWPSRLVQALRDDGVAVAEPTVIAATGWTTDELAAAIDAAQPATHDLVSLLIGVNDQYRGRSLDDYSPRFAALLDRAIALARGHADRVLVLAIPDWGVTPFGRESGRDRSHIAAELDAFNAAARDACERRGVAFVDIAGVYRAQAAEPDMLAADGLHPAAPMHALWARMAVPVVARMLAGG